MDDQLSSRLDEQRARSAARRTPETNEQLARGLARIRELAIPERAVAVGASAPDFALPAADGRVVCLGDLLRRGPVVLAFYRGVWWPYCNLQLQAYQGVLDELTSVGARLVAISPMLPDGSLSVAERHALEFDVLSDAGNEVGRDYGLVFALPDEIRELYEGPMKVLLPEVNGDESWTLPVPGAFVVDQAGIVRWRFVDPDHTRRADPTELVAAVRSLG